MSKTPITAVLQEQSTLQTYFSIIPYFSFRFFDTKSVWSRFQCFGLSIWFIRRMCEAWTIALVWHILNIMNCYESKLKGYSLFNIFLLGINNESTALCPRRAVSPFLSSLTILQHLCVDRSGTRKLGANTLKHR